MLSYQHIYHAGCFADVAKHLILTKILDYLVQKDKPLFYMETHAGRGHYDLDSAYAKKTAESDTGIRQLWLSASSLPSSSHTYRNIIAALNPGGTCRYYPGSPYFAQQQLRPQDRLVFCERHPQEFAALKEAFKQDKRILCLEKDGMQALKAMLPPKERRGLIFIDPSFEIKTEYRTIPDILQIIFKRFTTGVYCLWYPIVDNELHRQWQKRLGRIEAPWISVEFKQKKALNPGMKACGLWIFNPPYRLHQDLKDLVPIWAKLDLDMDIKTWNNAM